MASAFSYLNFIKFSNISRWDVKRFNLKSEFADESWVCLKKILEPYKKTLLKQELIDNKIQIIAKINFAGNLFLRPLTDIKDFKSTLFEIPAGCLIYSKINVKHGCTYFNKTGKTIAGTSEYPVFKIKKDLVDGEYLQKILRTNYIKKYLSSKTTGFSKTRVQIEEFLNTKIPLPSIEKQKEIVEKYNSKIKLAEEQENDVKNLEKEIENFWQKTLDIKYKNNIKNISKNSRLNLIKYKDLNIWSFDKNIKKSDKIISAFPIVNIENVCIKITDGTHQTPKYTLKGIKFLSAKDVTSKKITWENIKYISDALHMELKKRVLPQRNDILLAKNGTTGVAAIVDTDEEFSIYVSLALLRPNTNIIIPEYLLHYINSQIAKNQFNNKLIGIGVPNLHLSEIKNTKIILPNIVKQQEIVNKLNELNKNIAILYEQAECNRITAQQEFEKELFE